MKHCLFALVLALVSPAGHAQEAPKPASRTPENAARFIVLTLSDGNGKARFTTDKVGAGVVSSITSADPCRFSIHFGDGGNAQVNMAKVSAVKKLDSYKEVDLASFGTLGDLELYATSVEGARRLYEAFQFLKLQCNPAESLGF